jgi:hypothetical protein
MYTRNHASLSLGVAKLEEVFYHDIAGVIRY